MKTVKTITAMLGMTLVLFASDQRIAALGGNVGFWPDDDQAYTMFPAAINNLDFVQVSGAGSGNGSVGIVWGEGTTWGFNFDGAGDTDGNDMMNLLWGNGTYGVSLGIGSSQYNTGAEGATDASSMSLSGAVGMNMAFGEVGVSFVNNTADDGMDDTNDPTWMEFNFNLRRDMEVWLFQKMLVNFSYNDGANHAPTSVTEFVTIVDPFFEYEMDDPMTTWDTEGTYVAHNSMGLDVSMFTHLELSENVNGIFSLGFGYLSGSHTDYIYVDAVEDSAGIIVEPEYYTDEGSLAADFAVITLPNATLGVEASVTDWAAVRFGMNHSYVLSGSNGDVTWRGSTTPSSDGEHNSNFSWAFGLGFDYGSFMLDMVIMEDLFTNPVHYVTGRNNTPLSTAASITWNF